MSFASDIRGWVQGTKKEIDQEVRSIQMALFSGIILATPVDSGRARGNWQVSIGTPKTDAITRLDPSGAAAIAEVETGMGGAGGITWLTNNLPYIEVLEYGQYPNPPKKGTRIAGKKRQKLEGTSVFSFNAELRQSRALKASLREPATYEIRSAGGFSKQAPEGMVRINLARISQILRERNGVA